MKSCVLWLVAYAAVAVAGYTIFQGKVSESQRPSQLVNARSDESEVLPVTRKDGFEVLRRYHRQSGSRTSTSSAPFVLLYAISLAGKPELSARRACLQDQPLRAGKSEGAHWKECLLAILPTTQKTAV